MTVSNLHKSVTIFLITETKTCQLMNDFTILKKGEFLKIILFTFIGGDLDLINE